ncbi:MAG TPA: bifunctional transaldolase/phosoglucose isomerase [Candidatus Binatia bacterium]|nr:bifunctional transaldolase/phosoglucose isomerase [Candidatus Binatia bacterium]
MNKIPNPLRELQRLGQSPWQDHIHRGLLTSGALARLVRQGDVTGLTSNPTIFEQAIMRSGAYDEPLVKLVRAGKSPAAIADVLVIEDIRAAAKVFAPIYKRTAGADGYVSVEVSPALAYDTAGTVREAHRLWEAVRQPNLMIKIPATAAGLPAVEECIADGLNVNVTLIFALARYDQVMEAYLRGLERRLAARQPLSRVASVASFFVSRVDTVVDRLLEERIPATTGDARRALERLRGRAAIANAKLAYAAFRSKFAGERFARLAAAGARVQRPLWASTSTKNPAYPDVYYVDALVGPDTVNTLPPATLAAYRDHGHPEDRLAGGLDEAHRVLARLAEVGISMDAVTEQLEADGVKAFADSFDALLAGVEARCAAVRFEERARVRLGAAARHAEAAFAALDAARFGERLWRHDATLWKPADPAAQAEIARRLGWLAAPETMRPHLEELARFAVEVREAGFTHALLCGMGGSALAPELLRHTFGVARGAIDLAVLDSTDPAAVLAAERRSVPARTLYLVSSKSGSTMEVDAFLRYFWERVGLVRGEHAGEHFVAITDRGTALEQLARARGFRRVFLNPPDVGGRYSALTYFGLVPAALCGVDVARLLDRADALRRAAPGGVVAAHNPALHLGAVLGGLARGGRDKLTFLVEGRLAGFAAWAEQLVAESTGKEGRGIVPVADEPPGRTAAYGRDRLFVALDLGGASSRAVQALARAGHPVVQYRLADPYDLGAEILRWEIAVAAAAFLLEVNPFDQPNVEETKENTRRLLARRVTAHEPPAPPEPSLAPDAAELPARLRAHLRSAGPRAYVAFNAYLAPTPKRVQLLGALRAAVRDRFKVATTLGFGPRYLHSTGQLHKGGPPTGVFVQLTADHPEEVPVPGEPYSFAILEQAQALADAQALAARERLLLRVHLGARIDEGLRALAATLAGPRAVARPARRTAGRAARRRAQG